MKKSLLLVAMLLLIAPLSASAGILGKIFDDIITLPPHDDVTPSVPEPSGALLMGLGLVIAAAVKRRNS